MVLQLKFRYRLTKYIFFPKCLRSHFISLFVLKFQYILQNSYFLCLLSLRLKVHLSLGNVLWLNFNRTNQKENEKWTQFNKSRIFPIFREIYINLRSTYTSHSICLTFVYFFARLTTANCTLLLAAQYQCLVVIIFNLRWAEAIYRPSQYCYLASTSWS